jgi:hypothetical protein
MNIKLIIEQEYNKILDDNKEFNKLEYNKWKRENVTLRGIKELGKNNEVYGSFGKGLYTVPLSNKSMAKQYGKVYFVVGAKPKKPKTVNTLNDAQIFRQNLVYNFCKENGKNYSLTFFEENTSMEKEMLKLDYDGFVIKGREMVNYKPNNKEIRYFENEDQLIQYYMYLKDIR